MDMKDRFLECFCVMILTMQQEATSRSADNLPKIHETTKQLSQGPCSEYGAGSHSNEKNKFGVSPVENDTSSHKQIINLRLHLNSNHLSRLTQEGDGIPLQKARTLTDLPVEHKEQQTAEGKVNRKSRSLSHLISKRDVISNYSTSKSGQRNNTSPQGKAMEKLEYRESEVKPPYFLAVGLENYGGRILTTENTDISQLTSLHVGLLLVACSGAIILLLINCVGFACCTRYFTQKEPDTLLDASFSATDSGRNKWRYKSQSHQQHSVDIFPQASFEEDPTCGEEIKLQSFPMKDHGAIAKTPITSDHAICKNCNIWL